MPLTAGDRLGPYEVLGPIGAGGMGEVYKARDTRLDRTVAVKVLPPHFASDAGFRERFDREARAVAALNHPNICVLHDVGEQPSAASGQATAYLVMEYLEGETLATRLSRGPLPLDQALATATQIADALDKAHRHGIVHRDLKPGNVMLVGKPGGSAPPVAKLLDFGLAKLRGGASGVGALSAIPTEAAPLTAAGAILGTFQYMAPEQIEGQDADPRTDLFAFGVVLYEMLTGRRAFEGRTQASLFGAILKDQPAPVTSAHPAAPPALDQLLRACLAKDPEERIQTAHDVLLQLRWIAQGSGQAPAAVVAVSKVLSRRERRLAVAAALLLLATVALGTLYYQRVTAPEAPRLVSRFTIELDEGQAFTRTGRHVVALSPDGRYLAYVANTRLFLRPIDQAQASAIRGTDVDPIEPLFSPDGEWIAFNSAGDLKKVPVAGGSPVTLAKVAIPFGSSWSSSGIFVGLGAAGIVRVPADGGTPETVVQPDKGDAAQFHGPQLLPDGRTLLFTRLKPGSSQWDDGAAVVQPLEGGAARVVFEPGRDFRYVETGHLVFTRGGSLFGVRFDPRAPAVVGGPVPLVESVRDGISAAQYAVSSTGSLAFVGQSSAGLQMLVWVDRTGRATPVSAERRSFEDLALAPDASRIAVTLDPLPRSVWIQDVARGTLSRLTLGTGRQDPIWTADGKRVVFTRADASPGLHWQPADGSGAEERLTSEANDTATSATPDGRALVFARSGDLFLLPLASGDRTPVPLVQSPAAENDGRVSPDGRWLAYSSNETGRSEIYVRPFPGEGGRWQVSANGGGDPHWNPNGRELFFRSGADVLAVDVTLQGVFKAGTPKVLFSGSYVSSGIDMGYAAKTDRFVLIQEGSQTARPTITVVLNWFEELKRIGAR